MPGWSGRWTSTASAFIAWWKERARSSSCFTAFPKRLAPGESRSPPSRSASGSSAPDLRGFGASDKPRGIAAYATSVVANDIVALIHAFDAERAHVVGHDWGGGIPWTV